MNIKLEDGTPVKCKRRGLKITLSAGGKKGEGLMRRLDVSPDPVVMLDAALQEAAKAAGVELLWKTERYLFRFEQRRGSRTAISIERSLAGMNVRSQEEAD